MSRQIILHPGERIALRELHYRGELHHSVLLTYIDYERGIELMPWHHNEPPHTLYYSGTWCLIEGEGEGKGEGKSASHHYLLRHE